MKVWTLSAVVLLIGSYRLAPAQTLTFTVVHTFTGEDGALPYYSNLVQDAAGNLYGATYEGGYLPGCNNTGCGVVFEIAAGTGDETVFHRFYGGLTGSHPSGLFQALDGKFYGDTSGTPGLIFWLGPPGLEHVLYNFSQQTGYDPVAGLVGDQSETLFGTTPYGGNTGTNSGVVFELSKDAGYIVLHNFNGTDGASPFATLLRDSAGNLYGTTVFGGSSQNGVVFKVDLNGNETVLHNFTGADGESPQSQLIEDEAGNLYGVAPYGGADGHGVVYKLDATGSFSVLYNFTGGADGGTPIGSLFREPVTGSLYGTALHGGSTLACPAGCGVVYKLDSSGVETVLHTFTGGADGRNPAAGLFGTKGPHGGLEFYSTTSYGGNMSECPVSTAGCGTVFKITVIP